MKVMIVFNPVSGRGRSAAAAEELAGVLTAAGHIAICTPTRLEPSRQWLDEVMRGSDLAVIAGGDGAVRMAGAAAARTGTPIYHFPCGTENLFAREFNMSRDPAMLLRAIERFNVQRIDAGLVNGTRMFLLMCSIGFDAEVVHELAAKRGTSISHWTYVRPIARQLLRWRPCLLRISVDGRRIDRDQPGFVVVANSRQYGWRLDPAARASMSDGLLDVAFFPARTRLDLLRWSVRCRRQRHVGHPGLVYAQGTHITIASECERRFQLDGDPPEPLPAEEHDRNVTSNEWKLELTLVREAIHVLVP